MVSGWLAVLQRPQGAVSVIASGEHTHTTDTGSTGSAGSHTHAATSSYWMPKINDTVVCLYLPVWNGDGFVLGGV